MNNDLHVIIDLIVGLALMEAIVKPITVNLTQKLIRYIDTHVLWIPDWLYKDLIKNKED